MTHRLFSTSKKLIEVLLRCVSPTWQPHFGASAIHLARE